MRTVLPDYFGNYLPHALTKQQSVSGLFGYSRKKRLLGLPLNSRLPLLALSRTPLRHTAVLSSGARLTSGVKLVNMLPASERTINNTVPYNATTSINGVVGRTKTNVHHHRNTYATPRTPFRTNPRFWWQQTLKNQCGHHFCSVYVVKALILGLGSNNNVTQRGSYTNSSTIQSIPDTCYGRGVNQQCSREVLWLLRGKITAIRTEYCCYKKRGIHRF